MLSWNITKKVLLNSSIWLRDQDVFSNSHAASLWDEDLNYVIYLKYIRNNLKGFEAMLHVWQSSMDPAWRWTYFWTCAVTSMRPGLQASFCGLSHLPREHWDQCRSRNQIPEGCFEISLIESDVNPIKQNEDFYWVITGRAGAWFSSVTHSSPTLCDPMDCSTPGLPVHHQDITIIIVSYKLL